MTGPIGFIGTGAMGTAMVLRLLENGEEVVVHNRTRERAMTVEAAGATWAATPSDVVRTCSLVLTCLRDTSAIEEVYLGQAGLIELTGENQILVEHGTFSPALARRIAAAATSRGAAFCAAPVSGGPEGARAGSLAIMVGGDPVSYEAIRSVLAQFAGILRYMGGPAAGLELKLVNQLLTSAHMAAAGEAVALLRAIDIDLAAADGLLGRGWAQSAMLRRTLELVQDERIDNTGVTVQGMTEVLGLVTDLLVENHVSATVFDAGRRKFLDADTRGLGALDPAGLYQMSAEN